MIKPTEIIPRKQTNRSSQSALATPVYPTCSSCGRTCRPGATWAGANYCRGLILLDYIEDTPNLSAAELAQVTGMSFKSVTRALLRLREYDLLITTPEDRGDGSYRYRYEFNGDLEARQHFVEATSKVEAQNGL